MERKELMDYLTEGQIGFIENVRNNVYDTLTDVYNDALPSELRQWIEDGEPDNPRLQELHDAYCNYVFRAFI